MKLRLTHRAEADLARIADYLYARNPSAALRVEADLKAALRLISSYPEIGRRHRRDVRRFAVPRCPYLIFYGIGSALDEINIFTIRHAARREEH